MATIRRTSQPRILDQEELTKVMAQMEKTYGRGAVRTASAVRPPYRIPTGIFLLDYATLGGIPHNRVSMFEGPKHSGKSTAAERVVAGAQRSMPDQKVAFFNLEGTRDSVWGGKLGVDNEALLVLEPDTGEQAVDMADAFLRTKDISLVVVDSLAALVPMKEIDDSAEDAHVGLQSKLMTRFMRRAVQAMISERKRGHYVTLLLLNQQRSKIGGWSPNGDPVMNPGGKALGHATSLEVSFKNKEVLLKGKDTTDFNEHAFNIKKNKMNGGLRAGDFVMLRRDHDVFPLAEGAIEDAATMLSLAKTFGWYGGGGKSWTLEIPDSEYGPMTFGNAEEAMLTLYGDPEYYWALRTALVVQNAKNQGMPDYFLRYLQAGELYDE